jgi:DNA polymerase-3 subunit beta
MKLEIEKKDLLKMVSLAQTVAEKKANMSNLVNLLFVAEDGKLKVFATDLEISITSEAPVQIIESGTLAVHAKNLFEIAKELSDGPVSLSRIENNRLQIKQKRFSSKIMGSPVDSYPQFPVLSSYEFSKIPKAVLQDMIVKTIYSVSNDDTRYHLNGVYFERSLTEGKIKYKMVATDGHRLSLVDKVVDNVDQADLPKNVGVIIPRKGINEINRLLESVDTSVEIAVEGSQIIIKGGNSVLLIRLIEGKYPNYQMLIPKVVNHSILVQRESLIGSIKRVGLLANQKSRCVVLQISSGKMEISTVNPEMGDAHEEIEIQYQGESLKFTMNHRYIFEIINTFTNDVVEISVKDVDTPVKFQNYNDDTVTCVIMPMQM